MIYIAVVCWIKPEMGPAIPREELAQIPVSKRIIDSLKFALPPLALIFTVLGAIFFGIATPTEAAGVGVRRLVPDDHRLPQIRVEEFQRHDLPHRQDRHHGDHHPDRGHHLHRRLPDPGGRKGAGGRHHGPGSGKMGNLLDDAGHLHHPGLLHRLDRDHHDHLPDLSAHLPRPSGSTRSGLRPCWPSTCRCPS